MSNPSEPIDVLAAKILHHLEVIYAEIDTPPLPQLATEIIKLMRLDTDCCAALAHQNHWDASDITVITYGDTFLNEQETPLATLKHFLDDYCEERINGVHILPFFPYSSDDGFAVSDFYAVNPKLGGWEDISAIAGDYRLMADLVINHGSSHSDWFNNFKARKPRILART